MTPLSSPLEFPDLAPRIIPPFDPEFRPLHHLYRKFLRDFQDCGAIPVRIGLEREDDLVSVFEIAVPEPVCCSPECQFLIDRIIKFLLWSRGGWKIHFQGPREIFMRLQTDYHHQGSRAFDVRLMERIFEKPFSLASVAPDQFPVSRESRSHLGGHRTGCRIGFDLGASDYKIAAVCNGKVIFSAEIPWNPGEKTNPDYHERHIREGLKKAASHLPRVEAIGGSSAGVFINNRVRISSLFRSIPEDVFREKIRDLFLRIRNDWRVPFQIINDGEVTALAGMMNLDDTAVLGIAMGSSQAAGFLNETGHIPGWLDELAFAPLDANPAAAVDEWSGDRGVGANYFSQQAVNRLALAAGFTFPPEKRLPERLSEIQELARRGDERASQIFEAVGVYLGYSIPWYEIFYDFNNLLLLGRVMSGTGGTLILTKAREILKREFPETDSRIRLHLLDEKSRRVGQAVAAASLPEIPPSPHPAGAGE